MDNLYHVVNALPPVDNAFAGTVATIPINMSMWGHCSFLIHCGAGAVGTARITVEACSDTVPTATVPVQFYYQECISGDTFSDIQWTPDTTGFTTSAAADKVYKVEVDSRMLDAAGFKYVRLKSVEQVVGAITGSVVAVLTEGRISSTVPASCIV